CIYKLNLQTEQRNTQSQQECVQQGIHWTQNANVLGHDTVPQETKYECKDNNIQDKDGQVVQEFLGVARSENG
ncbi:hypothetical protein EBT25_07710, partial [bacterium]|nr:hypothetical protein [bacterium]